MAATDKQWLVIEDGCLSVGENVKHVTYHSSLNSVILSTKDKCVKILDATSGVILQKSHLCAESCSEIHCAYFPQKDRTLFSDGRAIGIRKDLRGVLLLDTALQVPVTKTEDIVKCELPLVEATQLFKALVNADLPGVDYVEEVLKEFERGIEVTQESTKGNHKTAKWATVCLKLPHCALKSVCGNLVKEMKRANQHGHGLSIASAITDRLGYLLPSNISDAGSGVERALMYSEAARRDTFIKWPHMNYKWALPDPMAQAGFYHQPNATGDDRAMCFTCNVCLVCWEPTDEPWSEHERHSPSCPFVKGEFTQNVPLSVTYATQPALPHGSPQDKIHCVSTTSDEDYLATSTLDGNIVVWDITRVLKKHCQFNLDPQKVNNKTNCWLERNKKPSTTVTESAVGSHSSLTSEDSYANSCSSDTETTLPDEYTDRDLTSIQRSRPSNDVQVTSLCVVSKNKDLAPTSHAKHPPVLFCGVLLRGINNELDDEAGSDGRNDDVQLLNKVNREVSSEAQIISELGGDYQGQTSCDSFPQLLVVSADKPIIRKDVKTFDKISKPTMNGEVGIIPPVPNHSVPSDWSVFLEDEPWPDPDVQIVGFTPPPLQVGPIGNHIPGSPSNSEPDSDINTNSGVKGSAPSGTSNKPDILCDNFIKSNVQAGTITQCLQLPDGFNQKGLEVKSITPTLDKQHIVVVISPSVVLETYNSQSTDSDRSYGGIVVYKVNYNNVLVSLDMTVCAEWRASNSQEVIKSILILPQEVVDQVEEEDVGKAVRKESKQTLLGQVGVILESGIVNIINLLNMNVLAEIRPSENDVFLSLTYCTGIERLCACTSSGKLRFYQISEQSSHDIPDGCVNKLNTRSIKEDETQLSSKPIEDQVDGCFPLSTKSPLNVELLTKKPLTPENLSVLRGLTLFENLMPRYTATVPPCWTEIQQEQQQRRHPQHLQQQGEATQHTRTWKLASDNSTWDEHMFEVVLPKPCCVGHVDIKFSLQNLCASQPNIEITLLRQNIGNIHKQAQDGPAVSSKSTPDVKAKGSNSDKMINPVITRAFLESLNAEILCGPVKLSNCLDLSGNTGIVSLTSPQLLNSKPRSLLIHLKGFPNKPSDNKDPVKSKDNKRKATPSSSSSSDKLKSKTIKSLFENVPFMNGASATERLAATAPNKKPLDLKGCDWLEELSITVRKMKPTSVTRERTQRNSMIDLQSFHEKLLKLVSGTSEEDLSSAGLEHVINMSLDILSWIVAIQMNDPCKRTGDRCIVLSTEKYLRGIIKTCIIEGTRTTAHKCSAMLAISIEYAKVSTDIDMAPNFSYQLLQAMLDCLPLVACTSSSGAMQWFFTLFNHVKCMDVATVSKKCMEILTAVAKLYAERASPLHNLLKTRYGLYGHPFDPDLFDVELPANLRQGTQASTYANVIKGTASTSTNTVPAASTTTEPDIYEMLSLQTDKTSTKNQNDFSRNHNNSSMLGLLEVEPLHFTCHSTSDGTRIERLDAKGSTTVSTTVPFGVSGTINFGEIPPTVVIGGGGAMSAMTGNAVADSLKKLAQMYAKQLHQPTYSTQLEAAICEAINTKPCPFPSTPDLFPPTPKSTPQQMTPSATPPNETWHLQAGGLSKPGVGVIDETKQLGSVGVPQPVSQQGDKTYIIPQTPAMLQLPTPQVLVIERMHSGARRFVTLDFGKSVLITDIVIPACGDLASLSIDVWIQGEEIDGQRLVVASDIGIRTLIMNNIMPPPVCRYLKITTVGRYGAGTTRSRIPIGSFFGHSYILPWEWKENNDNQTVTTTTSTSQLEAQSQSQLISQLGMFIALQEDLQCRYSLARTRLESLLTAVEVVQSSTAHVQYYLQKQSKDDDGGIIQSYNDCLQLQLQYNLANRAISRLQHAVGIKTGSYDETASLAYHLREASTDKLRVMLESLLDTLLSITSLSPTIPQPPATLYTSLTPQTTELLFKNLCLLGTRRMQVTAGLVLVRICGSQPWWGGFLGNMLQELFSSTNTAVFPQDRVFVLMSALGQRALSGPSSGYIMERLLAMLSQVLSPLSHQNTADGAHSTTGPLDVSLVSWILLFLCRNFDGSSGEDTDKNRKDNSSCLTNRWAFIHGHWSSTSTKTKVKSSRIYRRSNQKLLLHHKQKLLEFELTKKKLSESSKEAQALLKHKESQFRKEVSQYTSKHLKDLIHMRRTDMEILRKMPKDSSSGVWTSAKDDDLEMDGLVLPREKCLSVVHGLMALLLGLDSTCHSDLFVVAAKVLARICNVTRPAITLAEAMSQDQLERLILLAANQEYHGNLTWGGPWASHAIMCLLQDILDGERLYPCMIRSMTEEDVTVTETDDSLAQSVSLPTFDDSNGDSSEAEGSQIKENGATFDKDSSMMVDLLLDDCELDDETNEKLHEYVTGESVKPPATNDGPFQVVYMSSMGGEETLSNGLPEALNYQTTNFTPYKKHKMKSLTSKNQDYLNIQKTNGGFQGLSTALDSRLELGLRTQAELRLKVMSSVQVDNIHSAFSSPLPPAGHTLSHNISQSQHSTDDELSEATSSINHQLMSSNEMLSECFNRLFGQLVTNRVNLETVLHHWLILNDESHEEASGQTIFNSSRIPTITLNPASVSNLIDAVVMAPNPPVRTWVLVFQTLCLLANQKTPCEGSVSAGSTTPQEISMVTVILANSNLNPLLTKFLSGTSSSGPSAAGAQFSQVGPSAVKSFNEFLRRLLIKSGRDTALKLKELVLKLIYLLTAERGAFYTCIGPLDAQCKLTEFALDLSYSQVDVSNAISVIQSITCLVHQHIICQDQVACRSSLETNINARSCFGGLFTNLLRGGDSRSVLGESSRDLLMCNLMKLINILIQVQLPGRTQPQRHDIISEPLTPILTDAMSDTDKLTQALATSTPTVAMSDDQKRQQSDEGETPEVTTSCLADIILGHHYIMQNLIQALSYCSSNSMAVILGVLQENWTGNNPVSVGDSVYQILMTLNQRSSDPKLMLQAILDYMSRGSDNRWMSLCRLSEPLLWFILKVVHSNRTVKLFLDMGGVQLMCNQLVNCNQQLISTHPSIISTIMQHINNAGPGGSKNPKLDSAESDSSIDGMQNFAPLGQISSSSPTASPAEVLIQAAPPHRRARSAAWSYHFYPDEAWIDLTIQLPFAILLREVQIQPHASLSTCPSFVSLEISHDGAMVTPMCPPMMTSSLAYIKLQLVKPEVMSTITIRLHKARDSMTIGLAQVALMGHSAFGSTVSTVNNNPQTEDSTSKSSVLWVRLLHHCLSMSGNEEGAAVAASQTPYLLQTCVSLLVSPSACLYNSKIEAVLLKIGLLSTELGLQLINFILREPFRQNRGVEKSYLGKVSGFANQSTVEILYQLGTIQDTGSRHRVCALLDWLCDCARKGIERANMTTRGFAGLYRGDNPSSLSNPAPTHIHCIAAILWHCQSLPVQYDLIGLLNQDLVSCLYKWSMVLTPDSLLKQSIDFVLCSICNIQPNFFSNILEWMGILVNFNSSMTASITDDRKDSFQSHQQPLTDDTKEATQHPLSDDSKEATRQPSHVDSSPISIQEFNPTILDENRLVTLGTVCKSPVAVRQLLDSGFPAVLAQGLFEFANQEISLIAESKAPSGAASGAAASQNKPATNDASSDKSCIMSVELVASVLRLFATVSSESMIKDWLGSPEGNIFWPVLLTALCNNPAQPPSNNTSNKPKVMSTEERSMLETAAIHCFNEMISVHPANQLLFAKVLCDVIQHQGTLLGSIPLSGFTRRVLLQVLLQDERILVVLKSPRTQSILKTPGMSYLVHHPRYGAGQGFRVMVVNLNTQCSDLLTVIPDTQSLAAQLFESRDDKKAENKKDSGETGLEVVEYLSNAAGMLAKQKREKSPASTSASTSKSSSLPPRPPTRRRRNTEFLDSSTPLKLPTFSLQHQMFNSKALPGELTLSQLLNLLQQRGCHHSNAIEFQVKLASNKPRSRQTNNLSMDLNSSPVEDDDDTVPDEILLTSSSTPSALQIFASVGGLALLAEHLPLLYPEITRQAATTEPVTENNNVADIGLDWVTVESSDELYDPYVEPVSPAPTTRGRHPAGTMPTIPPHSLIAFGLFLRLPGYAEVLLKERKKAQCLLRLVLGVTDDGNGGHILTSPIANSLPTLPFTVLKSLFDATPLTTDDGLLLRRMGLDIGAVHLILACLSVLSHHAPRVSSAGFQHETQLILSAMQVATSNGLNPTQEKTQNYWAKGTGFGTGSTTSSWDAEQALLRQKSEEEHVTCLLQVLGSYINPGGLLPKDFSLPTFTPPTEKTLLPDVVPDLLSQSCLIPAISSYLRNDSVLDMARHVPLYRALLELLRGLAVCPSLVPLLCPLEAEGNQDTAVAIEVLLDKMKGCVDTYASRLKCNKSSKGKMEEESEGLALLIPDIQDTARIVGIATDRLKQQQVYQREKVGGSSIGPEAIIKQTPEEKYMNSMKELQFDTFEMVIEEGNGIKFIVPHHFESNVKSSGEANNASRTRRLAQEAVTLSTSLPLSASSSVFVRCDEDRLDIMKVLITGPADTPYANGCFEFDVYFPLDYPESPPCINLETTGNHTVRFNPNLYNDGKVCLSVLNTWHGRPEEKWNSHTSSFLQVLVSIQSLILVNEPYFNEPGYERSRGTPSGMASSREYDSNIRQATVKWAMLESLKNPSAAFKDVLLHHFYMKRHEILNQCERWISEMESYSSDKRTGRAIAHSTLALKRYYNQLREELSKLKPPPDLTESDEETSSIDPQAKHYSTDQSPASKPDSPGDDLAAAPSTSSDGFQGQHMIMLLDSMDLDAESPEC
ncbi:hypothetical protein SNE40_008714 [Patella caerulea]|uniref:Dual E2 ubiquitin-conjugating enzyme/E3 ubiquitin-protein ligase BIRC6 n=1 Tax=Patella caerulea TaxID=87958 RepID=A0AAN8JS06_PATCE